MNDISEFNNHHKELSISLSALTSGSVKNRGLIYQITSREMVAGFKILAVWAVMVSFQSCRVIKNPFLFFLADLLALALECETSAYKI